MVFCVTYDRFPPVGKKTLKVCRWFEESWEWSQGSHRERKSDVGGNYLFERAVLWLWCCQPLKLWVSHSALRQWFFVLGAFLLLLLFGFPSSFPDPKDIPGLPWWLSDKEYACQCRRRCWFDLWVGKILWRRGWLSSPVFLPGEFHGQRSLVGYSPWSRIVRHHWVTNTT